MRIIGVTGGLGSGKSSVSKILEGFGGFIIDADKINHLIMLRGNPAYNEIVGLFGLSILNEEKEIDRKALAKIVFSDTHKLKKLSDINHKYVIKRTHELIDEINLNPGDYKFIVLDAPLLIEARLHNICDEVWLVYSDVGIRVKRAMERDGMTEEHALSRINSQTPFDVLKKYADIILENNGNLQQLYEKVSLILERS